MKLRKSKLVCLPVLVMVLSGFAAQGAVYHSLGSRSEGVWTIQGDRAEPASIAVPHTMNEYGHGYDTDFSSKVFTYTRTFDVPADIRDMPRKFLRFERANFRTTVYVNGTKIGVHTEPHSAFEMDVTEALRDRDNQLKVVTEDYHCIINPGNEKLLALVGYQTTWDYFRGLSGGVRLVGRNKVYLNEYYTWGVLRGEDTPKAMDVPVIYAETSVVNTSGTAQEVTVTYDYRRKGVTAKRLESRPIVVPPGKTRVFQMHQPWQDPVLWWPHAPEQYDVTVTLRTHAGLLDEESLQFGFRDIYTRKLNLEPYLDARGRVQGDIWINGRRLRLFMDCWFVDGWPKRQFLRMWQGDERHIESMFRLAKAHNINALRLHMDAWPEKILDVADRLGMLIVYEAPFTSHQPVGFDHSGRTPKEEYYYDFRNPEFWDKAYWQIREMIKNVRQHPSLAIWCGGNEVRRMVHPMSLQKDDYFNRMFAGMADVYFENDPARDVLFSGEHENMHPYNGRIFISDHHYTNGMHFGNRTELPNIAPWMKSASGEVDWNEQGTDWNLLSEQRVQELKKPKALRSRRLMKLISYEPARSGNRYPFSMGEYYYVGQENQMGRATLFGGFQCSGNRKLRQEGDGRAAYHQTMNFRTFRNWDAFGFFTAFAPMGNKPLHAAVKEAFRPYVAYCRNYNDAFFQGQTFVREFVIMNDSLEDGFFTLRMQLLDAAGKVLFRQERCMNIPAGELCEYRLACKAPDLSDGASFALHYDLLKDGRVVDRNMRKCFVFAREDIAAGRPMLYFVHDRDLAGLAGRLSGESRALRTPAELSGQSGLLVMAEHDGNIDHEGVQRYVARGGHLLLLASDPGMRRIPAWLAMFLEIPLTFRQRPFAYTLAFKDPAVKDRFLTGIVDSRFLGTPVNHSETYGDLRFWGDDNFIARKCIRMIPGNKNFQALIRASDGEHADMRNVLAANIRVGKGMVTYCTLLVLQKYQICPQARKVLGALLSMQSSGRINP